MTLEITYGFDHAGGFIAIQGTIAVYAYPTSEAAEQALTHPMAAAITLITNAAPLAAKAFAGAYTSRVMAETADALRAKILSPQFCERLEA